MILADYHCHIIKQYYSNPVEYLKNLKASSGLQEVWSMGLDYETNLETLEIKREFKDDFLKIGIGFHPSDVIQKGKNSVEDLAKIKQIILENREELNYVGEIGMDFSYPNSRDFEKVQQKIFKELYELAIELDLPVSIHCREAWDEMMKVIDEVEIEDSRDFKGFIHSFTGNFEQGMWAIENGFKLGLNGIITFPKSEDLRNTIKELIEFYSDKEFDDLFGLETDSPYLSPEPMRGKDNNPENVKVIGEYIRNNIL